MKKVCIYQRTCTGSLQHMNYTESGFKNYYYAHKHLAKKNYNASCTIVSKLNITDATKKWGGL